MKTTMLQQKMGIAFNLHLRSPPPQLPPSPPVSLGPSAPPKSPVLLLSLPSEKLVPQKVSAPAPPVSPEAQKVQVESLFELLEAVRGYRRNLQHKVAKMKRLRETVVRLGKENQRLFTWVFVLSTVCVAL
jgi:hypothetical protein